MKETKITLLKNRNPITDLELTLKILEDDIEFYRNAIFPKINVEESEAKANQYRKAIQILKRNANDKVL